jgi:hypothetical protein
MHSDSIADYRHSHMFLGEAHERNEFSIVVEVPGGRAARQHVRNEPARAVDPVLHSLAAGARLYGFLDCFAVRGQQPLTSRLCGHAVPIPKDGPFGPYLAQKADISRDGVRLGGNGKVGISL